MSDLRLSGEVLDVGGKKENKRGSYRPNMDQVNTWKYLNTDESTNPDYLCSAEDIPVSDDTFDTVILAEVLEHLENPERVLQECHRITKKGGQLIATMPFLYPIHADPYDFQRWTPSRFNSTLNSMGYSDVEVTPMGSYGAVLYDITYNAVNNSSKNPTSIKSKILRRIGLPIFRRICKLLEKRYQYKNKKITTGYFVTAHKT